jgi:predicted metal-binding membrane protein
MWAAMMVGMMLPSLVPMLQHYRMAIGGSGEAHLGWLTAIMGIAYFLVWSLLGVAVYPLGAALAILEMQHTALARAVPIAVGLVVLIAGVIQFTAWKSHHLAGCREAPGRASTLAGDASSAWRQGVRFGLQCGASCANLTVILIVIGVMNLRAMVVVTAAITVERLAPAGQRIAQAIGGIIVGAGLLMIARAAQLG